MSRAGVATAKASWALTLLLLCHGSTHDHAVIRTLRRPHDLPNQATGGDGMSTEPARGTSDGQPPEPLALLVCDCGVIQAEDAPALSRCGLNMRQNLRPRECPIKRMGVVAWELLDDA